MNDSITLIWDDGDEAFYRLYQDGTLIAEVDGTGFEVRYLKPGQAYSFELSAVSDRRIEGPKTQPVIITLPADPVTEISPDEYLAERQSPEFKAGNTMLPLTKWSWPYSFELTVEMARWGYALDMGNADPYTIGKLDDPEHRLGQLRALMDSNPGAYKAFVGLPRIPVDDIPEAVYCRDEIGNVTTTWSPAAPDSAIDEMAKTIADWLGQFIAKVPVDFVHNGGERYLGVYGAHAATWDADAAAVAEKGDTHWWEYTHRSKARQEQHFYDAVKSKTDAPYILYPSGGNQYRDQTESHWGSWDYDYQYMRHSTDYPNNSLYFGEFNSGWKYKDLGTDVLSHQLNAHGYEVTFGDTVAYNWHCAGWDSVGFGDITTYIGYLKSSYMVGMLGAVAGYFSYPDGGFDVAFQSDDPPHWLLQVEALGWVHSEFGYLEHYIRDGELLSGPMMNEKNPDQPAYEFPTGYANARVLVRSLNDRWLISAWAADAITREVVVAIPGLGYVELLATPAASIYEATTDTIVQLDGGEIMPSIGGKL